MKYKSAFVFGKFLPFHNGHKLLVDTALENSDKVTLLVCSLKSEPIPGETRFNWAKEIYKNNPRINILHCDEELPQYPEEHQDFWNIWIDVAKRYCPSNIDILFTSELYGDIYANYLNIKHQLVDLERNIVPISGTKARTSPFENWKYLPDVVKPYFVKRIAIMGPESVGKSTLTQNISNHFMTNFVVEYGRIVYENSGNKVSIDDFIPISKGRQEIEDWMIKSSNKLLFCDTEDLTTYIFSKMYYPNEYKKIEEYFISCLSNKPKYDLYILLKPDCKGIQDGTRNFLNERNEHYEVIKSEMINREYNFVEVGGNWNERYNQTIDIIKSTFDLK